MWAEQGYTRHRHSTLGADETEEGACTASTPNWQVQVTRLTRGSLILLSVLGRLTNNGHYMEVTLSRGLSN